MSNEFIFANFGIGISLFIIRKKYLCITQAKLANCISTTVQTISHIESGKMELSLDLALRLCYFLDKITSDEKYISMPEKLIVFKQFNEFIKDEIINKNIKVV